MTMLQMFQPFLICLAMAGLLPMVHRRLNPRVSATVLTASVLWIAAVAVIGIWLVALRYLAHVSWLSGYFRWCSMIVGSHNTVSVWVGLPALVAMVAGLVRGAGFWRVQRKLRASQLWGTSIVASDAVFAYVVPGRKMATIISTGLLRHLNTNEQAVVFAHERAHAEYRHDRYLTIARAAEAMLPVVRPLTRRIEFSLERWADDSAAASVNGDRVLVARTIAKVALHPQRSSPGFGGRSLAVQGFAGLGFAGLGDAARAQFLINPPARSRLLTGIAVLSSGIGLTLALYQLHHFEGLIETLCHM